MSKIKFIKYTYVSVWEKFTSTKIRFLCEITNYTFDGLIHICPKIEN